MTEVKKYVIPSPIVDQKESTSLDELTEKYNKLIAPGPFAKIGKKAKELVPTKVKDFGTELTEKEYYVEAMKIVAEGFKIVEEQSAKFSISQKAIVTKVDKIVPDNTISDISEICFARSYDLAKLVNIYKTQDLAWAFIEGGTTGALGFAGIPFNLVLSMFLYFRAVQSVAMFYGYDIKNDNGELMIASEVFMSALNPSASNSSNEMAGIIGKIMIVSKTETIKRSAKKTWEEMANHGGVELLILQMRALANKSAKKALDNAGKKGLEKSIFSDVFEQIGGKLTQKTVQKTMPVVSAVVGCLFDTAQMKKILDYADIFYNKRFVIEKEQRVFAVLDSSEAEMVYTTAVEDDAQDVEFVDAE